MIRPWSARRLPALVVGLLPCLLTSAAQADESVWPGENWRRADPQAVGLSAAKVEECVDWLTGKAQGEPFGMVVVRHGRIAVDHYGSGAARSSAWEIGSLRKAVGSALLGMAIAEGRLTLDTRVVEVWPGIAAPDGPPKDRAITIRELFNSTSGWKRPEPPGTKWAYNNAAFTAGGMVLGRVYGLPQDRIAPLALSRIADPIGAASWRCDHYPQALSSSDGNPGPKLAIDSNLEDLARFGYLWLRGGEWNGRQIIPREYVRDATRNQARDAGGRYGLCWFINDGRALLPDAPEDAFFHVGNGRDDRRTVLAVVPSLDLVAAVGTHAARYDITRGYRLEPVPLVNEWIGKVVACVSPTAQESRSQAGSAQAGPAGPARVGRWDRFEGSVTNGTAYRDPYRDVTLQVEWTRPDGETVAVPGFHDGGTRWKFRLMPAQAGAWSYRARFSDGSGEAAGRFECVESDRPGMISVWQPNPIWFGFEGGEAVLVRSLHVGDRFFAENWPADKREAFLDWAGRQGYNMLSIGSFLLNRRQPARGAGWDTPDLWDGEAARPRPAEFHKLEAILDNLAARRMLVHPFAGFFGQAADFPTRHDDQEVYVKYTLARLGAYWNLTFNVSGPEPLVKPREFHNAMRQDDINRLGALIARLDPYDHPLSIHNGGGDDPFRNEPWTSFVTLQGQKHVDFPRLSRFLLDNHTGEKPVYAHEIHWPGNRHNVEYSLDDIRRKAWVMLFSGATINFGDMSGSSSSGFSGSMELAERNQPWHDAIKTAWDGFQPLPWPRTRPAQHAVDAGFCLAEDGREYLVYLPDGGRVNVTVPRGTWRVAWIRGARPTDRRDGGTTSDGRNLTAPRDGDWVLHLSRADEEP